MCVPSTARGRLDLIGNIEQRQSSAARSALERHVHRGRRRDPATVRTGEDDVEDQRIRAVARNAGRLGIAKRAFPVLPNSKGDGMPLLTNLPPRYRRTLLKDHPNNGCATTLADCGRAPPPTQKRPH